MTRIEDSAPESEKSSDEMEGHGQTASESQNHILDENSAMDIDGINSVQI